MWTPLTESTLPTPNARAGGVAVAVALAAANLLGYGFNLVAARRLGPDGYGAVAALLGLVLIGNVIALALQAVVARRAVGARRDAGAGEAMVRQWADHLAWRAGAGVLVVGLLASPLVTARLHLGSLVGAVAVALTLLPLTLIGAQLGVLQGAERFGRLAALYAIAGLGKVSGGVVGVAAAGSVSGAMVAQPSGRDLPP